VQIIARRGLVQAPQQTSAAAALTRPRKETRLPTIAAILRNRALTPRRRLAVPIPLPTARIPLLAAVTAAEAGGLLMAAVAEHHMEVAERHMVVEVAVRTAIVKINALHKGPSLTNEAGLLLSSPQADPKASGTTLCSFACLTSSSSPGRF
jgi:hypothetical protein